MHQLNNFMNIENMMVNIFFQLQVKEPESFRQLSLPQIEIPFRDMASIVSEAEAAIIHRFEVLEPQIYNSNARQVPKRFVSFASCLFFSTHVDQVFWPINYPCLGPQI